MRKISMGTNIFRMHPSLILEQMVLVTTLNPDGTSNIAPKSWVSKMSRRPPIVGFCCTTKHKTAQNILRSKEFVINVPGADLADMIWTIADLRHPRPVEKAGLTPIPASKVAPPLVKECKAHVECVLEDTKRFGKELVLFGRVVASAVDEPAVGAKDPYKYLQFVAPLSLGNYAVVDSSTRYYRKGESP